MAVKLRTVTLSHGTRWVRQGFRVFLRQPLAFAALYALTSFILLVVGNLPYVGPVIALALAPVATLAFMFASQEALNGRPAHPGLLLLPLKRDPPRQVLLQLGGAYAVCMILASLIAQGIDGRLIGALDAVARGDAEALRDAGFAQSAALFGGLLLAVALVFWHAPALVYWGQLGWAKAVFFSAVAIWRALGAFVVYGLAWFAVMVLSLMVVGGVFAMLGEPQLAALAALPLALMTMTVVCASFYFTFIDSFEITREEPPITETPDGT